MQYMRWCQYVVNESGPSAIDDPSQQMQEHGDGGKHHHSPCDERNK